MIGNVLAHQMKFALGTADPDDTFAAGTDIPANGSYIDISDAIRVHIILWWLAIDASDAPQVEPKVSDSASGTLDAIDSDLQHTAANDDDKEFVVWTIETESLATDHHFIALDVESGVTNGTTGAVFFLLEGHDLPVTQTTSVLPSASQYYYGGGGVSSAD